MDYTWTRTGRSSRQGWERRLNWRRCCRKQLKELRSWDKIESISINIIGEILAKNIRIEKEIINFSRGKNIWLKKAAILSTIPQIRNKDFQLAMKLIDLHLYDKEEQVQKAVGMVLKEIGEQNPALLRRIILKNMNMPLITFFIAIENHEDLRNLRGINNFNNKFEKLMFWKG